MSLLIHSIKSLVHIEDVVKEKYSGKEMSVLKTIDDAFIFMEDGLIHSFGKNNESKLKELRNNHKDLQVINARGKLVLPCWCDSHTHLVYAGSRENEFVDRIKGLTYEDIAKRGGGILNSAKVLRKTSEDELFESASERLFEIIQSGTGAVE